MDRGEGGGGVHHTILSPSFPSVMVGEAVDSSGEDMTFDFGDGSRGEVIEWVIGAEKVGSEVGGTKAEGEEDVANVLGLVFGWE
jgi:hypothetical protein